MANIEALRGKSAVSASKTNILSGKSSAASSYAINNYEKNAIEFAKRQQQQAQDKALLSATYVDSGKLKIDKNKIAQSKGFASNAELEAFKTNKPELYEAMGGVNYFPQSAPGTDTNKINLSNSAVNEIINRFRNTDTNEIDAIIKTLSSGEWQNADTMKKYSDIINGYANDYIALNELGRFDSLPEEERKNNVDWIKSLKELVNDSKDAFADYKDADSYNEAINNLKAYDKIKNADPEAVREEIDAWQKELDKLEKGKEWLNGDWRENDDGNYTVPYSATNISDFVGKTMSEIRSMVSQKRELLRLAENEAKITDLTNKAQSAVDFNAVSNYKVCNSEKELLNKYDTEDFDSNNLELLVDYLCTDSKAVRDSITNHRYTSYLEMYGVKAAESVNLLTFDWAQQGYDQLNDEEKRIVKYYAKTDVEKLYEYLELNKTKWKSRGSKAIAESIDGNILAQGSYAIAGAGDRIKQSVVGFGNYLSGKETYVEPTKTQLTSQYVRQNLEGFGAFAYDAIDTFTYMTPSILMNAVIPGSGFAVTGITAAGSAYNDGINMGMTASQARTYGTLIGVAEAGLEKLFSGVAGLTGKLTGKSIEKVVAGINSGIIKFVATVGVNAASEGFEEFAQEVLEPLFENIALGYSKNDWDDIDWDAAVYSGLLGMFMGGISNIGPAAINIASDSINSKFAYGQSQESMYALVNNGLAMPEGSAAYKLAVKADAKLKSGKKLSGTTLYNLATAIKSEIETKSTARLSELGVDKNTAKELSPVVAKAVFGESLTGPEHSALNNSEIAAQVVQELSTDRANTVWKNAIKNSRINDATDNNAVTEQGGVLQSTADDIVDEGDGAEVAQQGGQAVASAAVGSDSNTAGSVSGVVEGADGRQYFDDGSGDEYFGDPEDVDVAHGGDTSVQGENVDGSNGSFDLTEPTQKDIARAPTAQEAIEEAMTGKQKTNIQRHITDVCKKLDSNVTVEFVDGLKTNGKFIRSQNKILIRSDLSAVQMYVEVFKHEFMHRLETKQLYGKFFNYCFKKSKAFEQYVRTELKTAGVNIDAATREGVLQAYTNYKYDQYKNDEDIPQKDRDAFTMENAKEEIIADFFAQILFQGKKYRARIIEALENADGEALIGIGDEASSEAALLELQQKEPNLLEQVVQWFKDVINKLRGLPQAKSLVAQLDNEINLLESMARRAYQSKDSKRLMKKKLADDKYSLNPKFESQYDNWDRKDPRKVFTIGNTSDALKKIGVADRKITWDSSKIIKIKSTHSEMTDEIIKQVPNILEKPIIVMESKNNNSRLTMFGEVYSGNKPILAVLEIEPYGKNGLKLDEIKIASAYGKDKAQNFIETSKILYLDSDKKRVSNWELRTGLQLPVGSSVTNSKYSISNSAKNVNTEKSNDNSDDTPLGQHSLGSPIQQMRYNPEAYAKYLKRKYGSKVDNDAVAKKIKQIVAQDNKSQKAQEDTRQKVYDREGNLVGELTLKERLINEVAVEIAEGIAAPRTALADEVLSALKERPLVVNEKQETEIKNQYGTITNFRKDTGIRLVSENSEVAEGLTTLETAWNGDWVSEYPDLFDSDINDLDMPIRLAEIVDNLNGMTEEIDTNAIAAEVADNLTKTLNETGPKAEKRKVNEAYRKGVADERAKNQKQLSDLQKQNRNLKNRVKPKDVQNIRKEVDRIYKKLAANSSTKHVHQDLKKAVSEFLEIFRQNDEIAFKPDDRAKVTRLWREYSKLAGADETSEAFGYDAQIALDIEMLEEILPGRSIWELHPDELTQIKDIIANVSHCIETVNTMIVDGNTEEIATVANNVRVELGHKKGKIFDLGNLDLDMKNTTPVYFFERLGSKTMQKLFDDIKQGESAWAKNMLAAREKIAEIRQRYGYYKWKDATLKFTTKLGDEIELDLEQAMLLYATVKRERANLDQEAEHTYIGGVVIPTKKVKSLMSDIRGFTKRDGESDDSAKKRYDGLVDSLRKQIDVAPHQIRVSDFAKVSDFLTEQQKAYADEMVAYLSNDMAKLGNEVSMQLFGIEKFNEKYYIPYNSADNFIASMPGVEPTSSIKHRSFTKDLTHGANNPLMLTSFSEVCANHIEQMCMYNAMAIPVDNLTRVLNYKTPGADGAAPKSVKNDIERVLGKSGLRYINNLIRDMSGSVRVSDMDSLVGKLTGRYKKVAVLASLSVIIQQPTSVVRAFKYIPPKYFLKTTLKTAERNYNQMKQYVGEAIIKEMGGFDTGVGATNSEYLLQPKRTTGQIIDDVAGWGANMADQITWAHIWAASKAMVAKESPDLQVGSEAFFKKAAEICSETLSKTQVYDSILVKSEAMRSKSALSKMATAFMSEPTVTYNMMMSAMRDVSAHKKGAIKALANTSAVIIGQIVVNAAFKSLVYAMRDDDDDETYFEKWLSSFVESAASDLNYFNYLPFAKDIVSLMQGYSVERMDVSAIADIKQAIEKAFDKDATELDRLKSICTALSLITGVPVKNIWRDAEGAYNTIRSAIVDDYKNTTEGTKKAALVGFAEAVDWIPGIKIDSDGSGKLVDELNGNETYESLDDDNKQAVEKGVSDYLNKSEKFEKGKLKSKSKQFEDLYELRRKYGSSSKKYRTERKKMLDSGIDEKDLDLGLEIAKFKYLEQNGITVAEYYAAKTELNRKDGEDKVYDTDGSGGLNAKEVQKAIDKMKGFDNDEKDILFEELKP